MNKKLYRDEYHKVIGGVCAGLAEYFEMDPTIVRLIFAFAFFAGGVGFIPYIVLWIVLPKKGYPYNKFGSPTVDYTVPPQQPGSTFTPPYEQSNPFGGSQYKADPVTNMPPKQRSHAGIIVGAVLIMIGAGILIDNYDLIPDFDFERLWPVVFVVIGLALIASGQTRQVWGNSAEEQPAKNDPGNTNDIPPATENTATAE
ncbi:PspC domain-containing protein [uncultured Mucilaginibacter sp.]|uniref:PspC domain-containing protein n=1 Tax=uncultured Mucilaginibacter sp. TaxID=797541 RepID=UPI00260065A6|nr:PspC domain-containing protein [uncultured Mucilaginibacter sp.]